MSARQKSGRLEPFYDDGQVTLYLGDCRDVLPALDLNANVVVTDPPYQETACDWDRLAPGWASLLEPTRNVWCFGSLKQILSHQQHEFAGWTRAQEIVWEKHNGSGFAADRFKRVHEFAVQWYHGDWGSLYADVPVTMDATARTVKRRGRTPHTGEIGSEVDYETVDGGPRIQRSVIYMRSENGRALNETQKPLGILRPLITYSCPPGGLVLDPFSGAGSTLLAARDTGRRAIGIELRESQCVATVRRLGQGVLDVA